MRVCFLILAKCVLLCLALARVPLCTIYNLGVHAPIQTHNPLVWLTMDMQMRSSSQLNTPLDLDTHVYHTPSPPDVAHCGHVAATAQYPLDLDTHVLEIKHGLSIIHPSHLMWPTVGT